MTGVQYVKNAKGETTFLMVDWKMYGNALQEFLEDLEDIEAIKATENEESISIDEVRKELIKMGIPENELAKIPNV